jgi:hypothetical protein
MAKTEALTEAVSGLTTVVGEVVTALDGSQDQAAVDAATAGIKTVITDLQAALPKLAPTVTGVSPTSGPLVGGTAITVSGTGLSAATAVVIGGSTATDLVVVSDTQITATTAAWSSAGDGPVQVITPAGTASGGVFTWS